MSTVNKGDCFLCGKCFSKISFKNHILRVHQNNNPNSQDCIIVKIEDSYNSNYWLYVDVSLNATLKTLEHFLRDIWLECCGHLSGFFLAPYEEIKMSTKMNQFLEGSTLSYEYDFGSTTELKITIVGHSVRPKQQKSVRLLGRNQPILFNCSICRKKADFIDMEYYDDENPLFYCTSCSKQHEDSEMLLPVVNSPRMGVCGYCGEFDTYEFDVTIFENNNSLKI